MKKILLIIVSLASNVAFAQISIKNNIVTEGKKNILKIVDIGSPEENNYYITDNYGSNLVTVLPIPGEQNGKTSYLVSFINGEIGIAKADKVQKNKLINELIKQKVILKGELFTDPIPFFIKSYLEPFSEIADKQAEQIAKNNIIDSVKSGDVKFTKSDSKTSNIPAFEPPVIRKPSAAKPIPEVNKPVTISKRPETKETESETDTDIDTKSETDIKINKNAPEAMPEIAYQDRDITAPVLVKGKSLIQDNMLIGTYEIKIIKEGNKEISRIQFRNYKGKFVADVAFIAGQDVGRLYNALTKERTDMDLPTDLSAQELISEIVNQLLDLEIME